MLQRTRIVIQSQQQRAHSHTFTIFMPSKTSHHAVTIALMLHLQHHALVRLDTCPPQTSPSPHPAPRPQNAETNPQQHHDPE